MPIKLLYHTERVRMKKKMDELKQIKVYGGFAMQT
jgi:hypothetical protein